MLIPLHNSGSGGVRTCMGKNVSLPEMNKLVPQIPTKVQCRTRRSRGRLGFNGSLVRQTDKVHLSYYEGVVDSRRYLQMGSCEWFRLHLPPERSPLTYPLSPENIPKKPLSRYIQVRKVLRRC